MAILCFAHNEFSRAKNIKPSTYVYLLLWKMHDILFINSARQLRNFVLGHLG